jgi:hypothetical protein
VSLGDVHVPGCEHREVTSTLERPAAHPRPGIRVRRTRGDVVGTLPVAAVTAALWAAGVGLLITAGCVTLAWALGGRGDDGLMTPLSASGVVWLAGHHAPVTTPAGTVTLLPMLPLLLVLTLLTLAGRWAVRIASVVTLPDTVLLVVAATATYSCVAILVSQVASLAGAEVDGWTAFLCIGLLAAIGVAVGAVIGGPYGAALVARLPQAVREGLLAAGAIAGSLRVVVGVAVTAAIVARWSTVTGLSHQLAPGAGDAAGVVLLTLAYLPNLLVWALSYVAGPGIGVGAGATVDPFTSTGALLPGVPVLGALPSAAPAAGPLLLLLPVLAGVVGAVVLRHRRHLGLRDEVVALLVASGVVAVGTAVIALLASGSLGDGRLAGLGPSALAAGAAVGGLVAAGALLVSLGTHVVPRVLPTLWVHDGPHPSE